MTGMPETLVSFGIAGIDGEGRQDRESDRERLLLPLEIEPGRLLEISNRLLDRAPWLAVPSSGHSAT